MMKITSMFRLVMISLMVVSEKVSDEFSLYHLSRADHELILSGVNKTKGIRGLSWATLQAHMWVPWRSIRKVLMFSCRQIQSDFYLFTTYRGDNITKARKEHDRLIIRRMISFASVTKGSYFLLQADFIRDVKLVYELLIRNSVYWQFTGVNYLNYVQSSIQKIALIPLSRRGSSTIASRRFGVFLGTILSLKEEFDPLIIKHILIYLLEVKKLQHHLCMEIITSSMIKRISDEDKRRIYEVNEDRSMEGYVYAFLIYFLCTKIGKMVSFNLVCNFYLYIAGA
ncbi:uncharacterized protein LOC113335513 [Papaver somniferum]|uniref:uncharacterized protein LOC113335513 n=1 Tax=Papaver somniferum TaxID=3469 RepID=UPI000E6FD48D|nr:uncharacterized protein LOC113335513 [Papaver somniferum]